MTMDLTDEEIEYLSVLVADDLRKDQARGLHGVVERHFTVWAKLTADQRMSADAATWTAEG